MFSLNWASTISRLYNREAGDLRRHHARHGVKVMESVNREHFARHLKIHIWIKTTSPLIWCGLCIYFKYYDICSNQRLLVGIRILFEISSVRKAKLQWLSWSVIRKSSLRVMILDIASGNISRQRLKHGVVRVGKHGSTPALLCVIGFTKYPIFNFNSEATRTELIVGRIQCQNTY